MKDIWGIHWFRRDLRITGNKALRENWRATNGNTLGVFCFDSKFLGRADFSANRFAFFLKTLRKLQLEFKEKGGDLLVVDRMPADFFSALIEKLKASRTSLPHTISWNRDYEPYARDRDTKVASLLTKAGIKAITERDHLIFEPQEISKDSGSFYQIYTPFSRKWFEELAKPGNAYRIDAELTKTKAENSAIFCGSWAKIGINEKDQCEYFEKQNNKNVTIPIPDAGFATALDLVKDYSKKLKDYSNTRDLPYVSGTSRMSIFLKNGSITTSQIAKTLKLNETEPNQFFKEIVWREFYYHILFHRPEVEKKSFNPLYENIKWENRKDYFERWKEGKTGFPIVDAGMRELNQTGWMHNRVRMIVASFLTKDLLIDWRWGENYFMRQLLDGDLAPNNGGWQWAASTGCDPQPYFRIFNPWLQSEKFDPEGIYIKQYVPELKSFPAKALHDPDSDRSKLGYPAPMVNHSVQKTKALKLYKK